MKCHIEKVILWLKSGTKRELTFLPNKINVVTGGSNTGKTAILQIVDYCLLADRVEISEDKINENVAWYGLSLGVGDKKYTLCRKAPIENVPSSDYFFSSVNEIPSVPFKNNKEDVIKSILEADFCIDKDVKVQYGGKNIKAGSKVSLRYFLMFNTLSQDIISSSSVFFDMQDQERYREALPRIFDLAVGIDTVENILKREKREELQKELNKLLSRADRIEKKAKTVPAEVVDLVRAAKEYGLIPPDDDARRSESALREAIADNYARVNSKVSERAEQVQRDMFACRRKIVNLERFAEEYVTYKSTLKNLDESLKPIAFLRNNNSELIYTSVFRELFEAMEAQLKKVKLGIKSKTPIDCKVAELIKAQKAKLKELKQELAELPVENKSFNNVKEAYFFLGEAKAKLDLYSMYGDEDTSSLQVDINRIEKDISELHVTPNDEKRLLFVDMLQDVIKGYIDITKEALENYGSYLPVFNYSHKKLQLRKPKADFIENVGSSSNHMFLHLFLFLALHEVIAIKDIPYVPSFLIMDQPSRPYYGSKDKPVKHLAKTDQFKITKAFELMDNYVKRLCVEEGKSFQCIVFEHVPPEIFAGMEHVNLVETFEDGNALIPELDADV